MTIKPSPPSPPVTIMPFSHLLLRMLAHASPCAVKDQEWYEWIKNSSHWQFVDEESDVPMLCGNLTGARHCPLNYTCLCIGDNPNHGYTNFDNFMWSMLTTFQLITLDYWENVYNMVSVSCEELAACQAPGSQL
jgi:Ion transport protein